MRAPLSLSRPTLDLVSGGISTGCGGENGRYGSDNDIRAVIEIISCQPHSSSPTC